ncbi:MAG: M43 family zinc metalloprotease [Saprospiraceae bacterium]|nr:M43 family zinc metalloprotease [Saprospiraceae bacterium]
MKNIIPTTFILVLLTSCTPKLRSWFLTKADIQLQPIAQLEKNSSRSFLQGSCYDPLAYVPDTVHLDHTPIKYVRVNFHWMNSSDSSKNYVGQQAIDFTYGLLRSINGSLSSNQKMFLPHGNNTPALPTQYRFILTPRSNAADDIGIYFHFDDKIAYHIHKGKNANISNRNVFEKYGAQVDTVLNIFIMPHHPDSVKSETYGAYGVGVALGNAVKAAGMFENGGPPDNYRGIFNHEIGHIFGLAHTWAYNDGCDDTPQHQQNCWVQTAEPPCDTAASNNLMDYNAYQNAWTPCQIGKIHYRMAQEHSPQRNFLQPNWCTLHDEAHIFIRDTIEWRGAKDLEGHLTIESGGSLKINCRVALPAYAKITVKPGGTLILDENARLHNACGDRWTGIEIQELGKNKGQVIFIGEPKLENMINELVSIKTN